jgi:F0F1-type ATP synthase membrane subunit c/vacuolar-type H+-ATPase subunit K
MEYEPKEQVVIDLLGKIKNSHGEYPNSLMIPRREKYLKQVAGIGLGIGLGAGIKATTKTPRGGSSILHLPAFTASSLFETILVIAIIVEAGIVAYNFRDNIFEFLVSLSSTPRVEEVTLTSSVESPQPETGISDSPTPVETPTASSTVTSTDTSTTGSSTDGETKDNNNVTATPDPNDDEGKHLGQTPKPPPATKEDKNEPNKKP